MDNVTTVTTPHSDDLGALDGFLLGIIATLLVVMTVLHARTRFNDNKVKNRVEPIENEDVEVNIDNEAVV